MQQQWWDIAVTAVAGSTATVVARATAVRLWQRGTAVTVAAAHGASLAKIWCTAALIAVAVPIDAILVVPQRRMTMRGGYNHGEETGDRQDQ
jgi:hypothetical protein